MAQLCAKSCSALSVSFASEDVRRQQTVYGPLLRDAPLSILIDYGQAESGFAIRVSVVQHVTRAFMVEYKRIADHLAIPTFIRYIDAGMFVVTNPIVSVSRGGIADAVCEDIAVRAIRIPHFIAFFALKNERF